IQGKNNFYKNNNATIYQHKLSKTQQSQKRVPIHRLGSNPNEITTPKTTDEKNQQTQRTKTNKHARNHQKSQTHTQLQEESKGTRRRPENDLPFLRFRLCSSSSSAPGYHGDGAAAAAASVFSYSN
ncbi:hypothetical protein PIB30_064358, partial [Stylosanthes scabra]|nr:hypothetical protein [Stylosanthes scabra]